MPHTINGDSYEPATTPVQKLSDVPQLVPHVYLSSDHKPTKYGSFVSTIKNEDTGKEYKVYLPKYRHEQAVPGKKFIYCGLEINSSGKSFQWVEWKKI